MLHYYIDFPKQNVSNIILTILANRAIVVYSSHVHVTSVFAREDMQAGWTYAGIWYVAWGQVGNDFNSNTETCLFPVVWDRLSFS